jgi:hypothetical protein
MSLIAKKQSTQNIRNPTEKVTDKPKIQTQEARLQYSLQHSTSDRL